MNNFWTSTLTATTVLGLAIATTSPATAADLGIVAGDGTDGIFERLVPVSPGVYGLEARGGIPGAGDWEIGVGTQTSVTGSFEEDRFFEWGDGSTSFPLTMTWTPGSLVSVTIGDSTVSYAADWDVGNGVEIFAKQSAAFQLLSLDGVAFDETVGAIGGTGITQLFLAGDSLLDGWSLEGEIAITAGNRSDNEIMITTGTFTPNGVEETSEPAVLLGLLSLGAVALGKRFQTTLS